MLAVSANLVAYAPNRSNPGLVVTEIHLAARIVDVHVYDIGHGVKLSFHACSTIAVEERAGPREASGIRAERVPWG